MFSSSDKEYLISLFEHAPISLWEQDFSLIKRSFDELRAQGVMSLAAYLDEHPGFIDECIGQIRTLNVNQKTVSMLKAGSKENLIANLAQVFRDGMRQHFRDELLALWQGDMSWSGEGVNYTLEGDGLDISLHWRILPGYEKNWERVLVTIEDITARKTAERRLQSLFEASPISLWEEDYSGIKSYFDSLRLVGVTDLEDYLEDHPDAVLHCAGLIKVINVNQKTLDLFGAQSKEQLMNNLNLVFRDEMGEHFAQELIDLWNGKLVYEREGVNYSLNGETIQILLNFRIMPGHEETFSWALVTIQDITARKKAEEYLQYLGTHDVMTGLYNRTYFEETIQKLEASRSDPVSIIIIDLNYLKRVNDAFGHQAGDKLIRRVSEVLHAAVDNSHMAARIGGDEFVVILNNHDEDDALEAIKRIQALVILNNKYYRSPELSISIGSATSYPGLSLERVIRIADDNMYKNKAEYHRRRRDDTQPY
ncbi:MAG: diguanylate cyclase [Anaerolineales bacterium]|nr:diguanylate cyclase [Anaerolineales bacterium]